MCGMKEGMAKEGARGGGRRNGCSCRAFFFFQCYGKCSNPSDTENARVYETLWPASFRQVRLPAPATGSTM